MAAETRSPAGCLLIVAGIGIVGVLLRLWGPWRTLPVLLVLVVGVVTLKLAYRSWFPVRATRELNKVIVRGRLNGQARLVRRKCRRNGYQRLVAWKVPTGVTTTALTNLREVMEHALDCSAEFWFERGVMWMRAGTAQLPQEIGFGEFYEA
jgi:hypothetical protein